MAAEGTEFTVVVIDNFHRYDDDERTTIHGFESAAHAATYGMRRVRSSVEQFREPEQSAEELYAKWIALGEEVVVDGQRFGARYFDHFAANVASEVECDYLSLTPVGARYS
jgi:hypothetical protein